MLRNRPSLFVLENIGIKQDKVHEERSRLSSRNSITSRACLVSLLLGFPFRLFFFHLHPGKCGASQEALPRLVPKWQSGNARATEDEEGGQTMGRTILPVPLARRVIAILRQPNIFFAYSSISIPVREWGGRGKKLGADCVLAHREGVHHFGGGWVCWAFKIPVCSRRFVWRMGWSARWLNRSGNAPANERGVLSIHPSNHPVDARQAYCSILRPALISSLYAFNHVRVCGWVGE